MAFVYIMNDGDAVLPDRVADTIDPGKVSGIENSTGTGYPCPKKVAMFARWNAERSAVEFSIGIGEHAGVVRVSRRVFQILPPEAPTPERW